MTAVALIGYKILEILNLLLSIFSWVIIANALLSWFLPPDNIFRQFLSFVTEPVVGPFRRLTQRFIRSSAIPIDISPVLAIFAIMIVQQLLSALTNWIY
jgi:YggT family protein